MKTLFLVPLAVGLVVAGCSDSSSKSASGTNATSVDYLGSAINAKQRAVKTIDTASLDKAIQMFNVQKGRNPKDLNELVTEKYISEIPPAPYGSKIEYDANSGTVSVVKQ